MRTYAVWVKGQAKGRVYRGGGHSRWWWQRNSGSREPFPPRQTLKGVKSHIARLCLVEAEHVVLERVLVE